MDKTIRKVMKKDNVTIKDPYVKIYSNKQI